MKNVLIITSSLRKNSNSEALADAFAKGAESSENNVEKISLAGKTLAFCRGCMACHKLGRCAVKDDALAITEKMLHADVIAFATPVYYYSICGQLKTMLDRANSLYYADYAFRDIYMLATAAEDEDYTFEGAQKAIEGWIDCYEKASLAGTVFAGGVNDAGDISSHKALEEAFNAGKAV